MPATSVAETRLSPRFVMAPSVQRADLPGNFYSASRRTSAPAYVWMRPSLACISLLSARLFLARRNTMRPPLQRRILTVALALVASSAVACHSHYRHEG